MREAGAGSRETKITLRIECDSHAHRGVQRIESPVEDQLRYHKSRT